MSFDGFWDLMDGNYTVHIYISLGWTPTSMCLHYMHYLVQINVQIKLKKSNLIEIYI